jgi:hypothetical protein
MLSELDVLSSQDSSEGGTGDDVEAIEGSGLNSCSLCLLIVLVPDERDIRTMLDVLAELAAVGVETNDDVRALEGSYVGHAPGVWGREVMVLVLAKLEMLAKLKAGEVKAAGFEAVGVEANDDLRAIEDA